MQYTETMYEFQSIKSRIKKPVCLKPADNKYILKNH